MKRTPHRSPARSSTSPIAAAVMALGLLVPCAGAGAAATVVPPSARLAALAVTHRVPVLESELVEYTETFERAELVERMLTSCRGVAYNALELWQSSGESLRLPAPTQLLVVRVRHPYCAELLRTYAPKTAV